MSLLDVCEAQCNKVTSLLLFVLLLEPNSRGRSSTLGVFRNSSWLPFQELPSQFLVNASSACLMMLSCLSLFFYSFFFLGGGFETRFLYVTALAILELTL